MQQRPPLTIIRKRNTLRTQHTPPRPAASLASTLINFNHFVFLFRTPQSSPPRSPAWSASSPHSCPSEAITYSPYIFNHFDVPATFLGSDGEHNTLNQLDKAVENDEPSYSGEDSDEGGQEGYGGDLAA